MQSIIPRDLWASVQRLEGLEARYLEMVEEAEGVVTDATVMVEEGLAEMTDDVLEPLCWYVREAEAMVAACQAEEKRLAEVKRRAKARVPWAKEVARGILGRKGVRKMKAGTTTVRLDKSPEKPVPSGDEEPDAESLPKRFQRIKTTTETDKTALAKALKAGETVEGYKLGRGPDKVVIT